MVPTAGVFWTRVPPSRTPVGGNWIATSASDAGDPRGPRVRRTDAWNAARARRHALSQSSGPYVWRRRASPPSTDHAARSRPSSSIFFFASNSPGDPSIRGASLSPTNVRSVDQSDLGLLPLDSDGGVVGDAGDAGDAGGGGGGGSAASSSSSDSSL